MVGEIAAIVTCDSRHPILLGVRPWVSPLCTASAVLAEVAPAAFTVHGITRVDSQSQSHIDNGQARINLDLIGDAITPVVVPIAHAPEPSDSENSETGHHLNAAPYKSTGRSTHD